MDNDIMKDFSIEDAFSLLRSEVGAIIYADGDANEYRALVRRSFFSSFINEKGTYPELIEKLWFHFNKSSDSVVENYHVFIPAAGKFPGKYSKRINIVFEGIAHTVQMTVYPINRSSKYLFMLDELDSNQYLDDTLTNRKVDTIQNTFLFSMYIDLTHDSISSISVTEISDEVMNQQLKYSDWRDMIVKMIYKDDQHLFEERSDPKFLKNLAPGRTSSFDCQMMNLEGKMIWVKIIFSRAETENPDDYRYVYMVQNIHETAVVLMSSLKKYEVLALRDPLTAIYNHGRIETEICNAIDKKNKTNEDVSIMILDIDFFKNVNDLHGHVTGDTILYEFAQLIKDFCKERNAVIGRWGGEEFVTVCYGKNQEEAEAFANEIRALVENNKFSTVEKITCSIGITSLREKDELDNAFKRMDHALYTAKNNGRNCVISN